MRHSVLIKSILCLVVFYTGGASFAQQVNMPFQYEQAQRYDNLANNKNSNFHSNCKPFVLGEVNKLSGYDSLQNSLLLKKRVFNKHFIMVKGSLVVDPVLTAMGGYDVSRTDKALETAIGAGISLMGKRHFAANYTFALVNGQYPYYLDSIIRKTDVIPGQGYADSGSIGYKSILQTGYVAYAPNKVFRFEAGNGKNFFGDGYRSLLLSDNAYNYPYLKVTTTIWKFKYTNLFAELRDIRGASGNSHLMKKKYAAFHYLSWNVTKRFNFSFF